MFEENDNFFCAVGAGVHVESVLWGVLLSAEVNDVVGLLGLPDARKNLWC